jgi:nucleotide-binding universal stress UspA family protein
MQFQRILVPVDFSRPSDAGVRAAGLIAARNRASIALLHVVPPVGATATVVEPVYVPPELTEGWNTSRLEAADGKMAEVVAMARTHAGGDVDVTSEVVSGDAVEEILAAADRGADLLVLGSSGLTGLARLVLGSVAEKVSRLAPCPVLVVSDRDHEPAFSRIMVGIDFSPLAEAVTRLAAATVGPGGQLDLVHVWEPPALSTLNVDLTDLEGAAGAHNRALADQQALIARRLARFAADLTLVGVKLTSHVALGSPVAELLERAGQTDPDVIALGSHAREGITEKLLGTVADRVLRNAARPVLLLPRAARDRWTQRP